MDPEDALRKVRQVALGLLIASLFADSVANRLRGFRYRVSSLQYRVVPDVSGPGVALADIAIEILGATSRDR